MITASPTFLLIDNNSDANYVGPEHQVSADLNNDIMVSGDLNGATVIIEQLAAGGWVPISGGTFTEVGSKTLAAIPMNRKIRARVDGTGAGIYVELGR